jgi:ribosomal protein S27AE
MIDNKYSQESFFIKKKKCPQCYKSIFLENDDEIMYKNTSFIKIDKKNDSTYVICRSCHYKFFLNKIPFSE